MKGLHGHFPIIPLKTSMVKMGSHNMAVLYPNPCYNKVCYKGTSLLFISDTGRNRTDARKLSKSLTMDVEKAKTSLGMIEEDDSDNVYNRGNKTLIPLQNDTHSKKI